MTRSTFLTVTNPLPLGNTSVYVTERLHTVMNVEGSFTSLISLSSLTPLLLPPSAPQPSSLALRPMCGSSAWTWPSSAVPDEARRGRGGDSGTSTKTHSQYIIPAWKNHSDQYLSLFDLVYDRYFPVLAAFRVQLTESHRNLAAADEPPSSAAVREEAWWFLTVIEE